MVTLCNPVLTWRYLLGTNSSGHKLCARTRFEGTVASRPSSVVTAAAAAAAALVAAVLVAAVLVVVALVVAALRNALMTKLA